jgi:hypothetical protein
MADNADNNVLHDLMLENFRAIRGELTALRNDATDIRSDLRSIKSHMAGFMQSEVAQDGALASIQSRLEWIERRLELHD